MNQSRLNRVIEGMKRENLPCILVSDIESVFYLTRNTAAGIGEKSREFVLKVVLLVSLPNEVQNGEAFFAFCQSIFAWY